MGYRKKTQLECIYCVYCKYKEECLLIQNSKVKYIRERVTPWFKVICCCDQERLATRFSKHIQQWNSFYLGF